MTREEALRIVVYGLVEVIVIARLYMAVTDAIAQGIAGGYI